jgi:glycosyltransferase involved in cell wall biosynthesis
MKIALLTDGITPYCIGGMQRHSGNLCKHLLELGYHVTLVHCVYGNSPLPGKSEVKTLFNEHNRLEVFGFKFPSQGQMPGHYLKESYTYSTSIYKALEKEWSSFDLIIAKGFSAWRLIELKEKKKIKLGPIAVNFHGLEMFQIPATFQERLKAWMLRGPVKWNIQHADFAVSYGGKISEIILKLGKPADRIVEIPSGIDSEWLVKSKNQNEIPKFVFLGRYERRKSVEEINSVISKHKNIEFHFVGDIPFRKRIKLAHVHYHGSLTKQEDIWKILDSCDILVSPSYSEGMPNVLLEGMARGLIPICTNVGAVSVLVNKNCGILIASPSELEDAMLKIIETSQEQRQTLSDNALIHVKNNFTWEKIREETHVILHRIIEKS